MKVQKQGSYQAYTHLIIAKLKLTKKGYIFTSIVKKSSYCIRKEKGDISITA
jgi:hypothetical protein